MSIDPGTWCLPQVEDALRASISRSTKFQAWVGAANETAALAFIHIDEDNPPADGKAYTDAEVAGRFPQVIIEPPQDGESFQWEFHNHPKGYLTTWALSMRFIKAFEGARPYQEERRQIKNEIGEIVEQVLYDPLMRFGGMSPVEYPIVDNEQDGSRRFWHYVWNVNDDTQGEQ